MNRITSGELRTKYKDVLDCDFECLDGWLPLIQSVLQVSQNRAQREGLTDFKFLQIKEKFGCLRMYHTGGSDYIAGVVDTAEYQSCKICEVCGAPGEFRVNHGWYQTLCDEHNQEPTDVSSSIQ